LAFVSRVITGKTTVIGPILAMMLANGKSLVTQVRATPIVWIGIM
jgi:hypothetical protein